uniref:Uncharacterized protein n=1 Tax=Cacopsylla melanoneura TaxID=428564 RepID=A0A8D8RIA0_9HEMI
MFTCRFFLFATVFLCLLDSFSVLETSLFVKLCWVFSNRFLYPKTFLLGLENNEVGFFQSVFTVFLTALGIGLFVLVLIRFFFSWACFVFNFCLAELNLDFVDFFFFGSFTSFPKLSLSFPARGSNFCIKF